MSLTEEQVREIVRNEFATLANQCLRVSLDAELDARKRVQAAIAEHQAEMKAAKRDPFRRRRSRAVKA